MEMDQNFLRKEVYAVPDEANTLVYAPLTRHVALFEGAISLDEIDPEWLAAATDPANVPAFIEERGFVYDTEKIRLRLNVTPRCNLMCGYCSVRALPVGIDMPMEIALAAIRQFIHYGQELGAHELEVVFSGGEPSLRLDSIEQMIQFARQAIAPTGLKLSCRILTNGLFSEQLVPKMKNLFQEVQISWDGNVPNHPRYGSDDRIPRLVWANLLALLATGVPISVLTVVSPENQADLRVIVRELYEAGVRYIFLALEDGLGRSSERNSALDYVQLTRVYLNLWHEYQAAGMEINLTGTDVHSISPFPCSVPIPNYSVAPDGNISACTIAFNDRSERAAPFHLGTVGPDGLVLDQAQILSVRQYSVLNMDDCESCFAKWHCRGCCPYSSQRRWPDTLPDERCQLVRTVVAEKIRTIAC